MPTLKSFKELDVWQAAHQLALGVYRMTGEFPKYELYGITSQVRRAVFSVPSNIAEGWGRRSTKDFFRHLAISNGSLEETRYFLLLATDLGYSKAEQRDETDAPINRIGAMLAALERSLKKRLERS